ncbi:MAG: class I SAM-dependent methyltransferase [Eubacteriales bacterium]|nr:class I SAM-dependent methyltransferase [Eubacteriales bacterium]
MDNLITKPTKLSLNILSEYISKGDIAIDATAGNGHDTLALAKLAGSTGKVYAFDIQKAAIDNTKVLLEKEGFLDRCELILDSHQRMDQLLPERLRGSVSAVVFNLGYLPGGEKDKTTQRAATLPAVEQALSLIRPGGIVAATMYGGHPAGAEEKTALLRFAKELPQTEYHAAYLSFINQKNRPPELLLITRK